MPDIARQWFIPGEGIDRHVISADIQRYLGNDATVRPGQGTGSDQGISGYWIKAYRNLTSAMIADLRADSARWRQEQRSTGTRGPYEGSSTYNQSSAARVQRRDADSPSLETYQSRDRVPTDNRRPQPMDAMDIDPPPQPDRRGHGHHAQPPRVGFPPDNRGFAPQPDSRNYQPNTMMSDQYGRPPVTSSYGAEPRYATGYAPQPNDAAMSGFGRQPPQPSPYYSTPPGYDTMPAISRPQDPSVYPGGPQYGQPQQSSRPDPYRDQRDVRGDAREPRYPGRDYRDPSDAYPSPATTVTSMNARDRDAITSPPNPSMYSQPPYQPDPYGRTMQPQQPPPQGYTSSNTRDQYSRDRPPPGGGDNRDARRRRHG